VERRAGWDCHGLPVEFEIDKLLGIKTREQVLEMGIDKYNEACRGIVTRYTGEWETTVKRLGRWIDFEDDYKTMDKTFMESVWWVFKQLNEKKLVYQGHKVMPYSMACGTPLSNFEANLNYQEVNDPAVVVNFPVVPVAGGGRFQGASLLAWTTTPWTLPSNLALCVNADFLYIKIQDKKGLVSNPAGGASADSPGPHNTFILLEKLLPTLYPEMNGKKWKPAKDNEKIFSVLERDIKGTDLVGTKYEPLFDYFVDGFGGHAFRVVSDGYVTDESGTGIVHQAPAFGEDDSRVCIANGIYDPRNTKLKLPCPLDFNGNYTDEVPDWKGQNCKAADEDIVRVLKERGRLVKKGAYQHSYPFCWRSDTPLIYKAVPSWFVAVEQIKDRLLANNAETYWVPNFVKEGRFHNWLADARDWAISRNRFWGTPIPMWVSDDMEEMVAVGSVEELETLAGLPKGSVTDLHKEFVDHIEIPSKKGKGKLKRVDEVFDCWFESGSMPYAQLHYPFENKDRFEKGFPAHFIAEGLDQTRGWFYTLMVLSTALFDKPAFTNLIVNGMVLAADGKKMSKRLKNYPPPDEVVASYGADALRMYLINSPVVRAEPLKFRKDGVYGVVKDVMIPWYNAFRFMVQNASRWEGTTGKSFRPKSALAKASTNQVDVWILAEIENLVAFVHEEMGAYRLFTVMPRLVAFLEGLTKWYLRLNRDRIKGADGDDAAEIALSVTYDVLLTVTSVMSPFTPFFSEYLYQKLRRLHPNYSPGGIKAGDKAAAEAMGSAESVHFLMLPRPDPNADVALNVRVAQEMEALQTVVELGRKAREAKDISLKKPVVDMVVVVSNEVQRAGLTKLQNYLCR
jgi:isoleucyl-tRNA synthetase